MWKNIQNKELVQYLNNSFLQKKSSNIQNKIVLLGMPHLVARATRAHLQTATVSGLFSICRWVTQFGLVGIVRMGCCLYAMLDLHRNYLHTLGAANSATAAAATERDIALVAARYNIKFKTRRRNETKYVKRVTNVRTFREIHSVRQSRLDQ